VLNRRAAVKVGALGAAGLAAAGAALGAAGSGPAGERRLNGMHGGHDLAAPVGTLRPGGFDPTAFLGHFEAGRVSRMSSGQTLREFEVVAVAPGVFFPAWTYNGQVPGPTIRCTEGDRVRVRFVNAGTHAHTLHFHGIHAADMDGVFEIVDPGSSYIYEFDAEPFGLHMYHCHAMPLKRHLHKGLYGTFLIDPREGRPAARELVMVMNGFDTNFDGENEIYAVNTVGFHYQTHPIKLVQNELVRVYLVNATEFDLINSFHLHGNFFKLYRAGTSLGSHEYTDTVMLCQGERAVLEFAFKHTGRFMFHAHQSEFAELGWIGIFEVEAAPHA
jgi:FtsP/CotA-like multicopper oxidase with cupredoxin domain